MADAVDVTVCILTFNGEKYLSRILTAIEAQSYAGTIEILVIDSGSTDGTLEIVAAHPAVRLHAIPNSEFGHGKTRNLAAQLAKGRMIAYLTHDAVPVDDYWLDELVRPLELFPAVEAVLGRQVGRPDCVPILKYEIRRVFQTQGPEFGTTISYRTAAFERVPDYWLPAAFYSDVNSATRTAYVRDQVPYQDVAYAEDQLFGRQVIESGAQKAYSSRGAVEHSNDLSYREYKKRLFDEIVGLRMSGAIVPPSTSVLRRVVRGMMLDPLDILRDSEYSAGQKLYWLVVNPFFHIAKSSAVRRARKANLTDVDALDGRSLEAERRKRSGPRI